MKHLLLVRHGPTDYTVSGRFCGRDDPALTEDGVRAARMVATHPVLEGVDLLVSSPSQRAAATAAAIAERHRIPLRIDERLREIDFGAWEGLTRESIERRPEYARWHADPGANAPPGGESGADAQRRLIDAVDDHLAMANRVVFVSHKGAIRLVLSHLTGGRLCDFRHISGIHAASVSHVRFGREGVDVQAIGDTSHLDGDVDLGVY